MAEATAEPASAAVHIKVEDKPTLTPPASEGTDKNYDSGSELSDLEVETIEKADNKTDDDGAEIEPDHYYEGGKIPVFKPVRALQDYHAACPASKLQKKSYPLKFVR